MFKDHPGNLSSIPATPFSSWPARLWPHDDVCTFSSTTAARADDTAVLVVNQSHVVNNSTCNIETNVIRLVNELFEIIYELLSAPESSVRLLATHTIEQRSNTSSELSSTIKASPIEIFQTQ